MASFLENGFFRKNLQIENNFTFLGFTSLDFDTTFLSNYPEKTSIDLTPLILAQKKLISTPYKNQNKIIKRFYPNKILTLKIETKSNFILRDFFITEQGLIFIIVLLIFFLYFINF